MKAMLVVPVFVVLSGCQELDSFARSMRDSVSGGSARADLEPTQGSQVRGTVHFVQNGDRVRITGTVSGLRPDSEVGFHIHEAGDCSSGDGMSAKGHFNPQGKPHGHPTNPDRHAGDLPMLRADAAGFATVSANVDLISVAPGPNGIVGRGLIVHAQPDDYRTQPTGNAGARSACAVIKAD